jgi:hypothetical protein
MNQLSAEARRPRGSCIGKAAGRSVTRGVHVVGENVGRHGGKFEVLNTRIPLHKSRSTILTFAAHNNTAEVEPAMTESIEIANTETPLFELDLPREGVKLAPRSFDELVVWLERQRQFWTWLNEAKAEDSPIDPVISAVFHQD